MPPTQTLQQLRDRRGTAEAPPQMVVPPPPLKAFATPALRHLVITGYITPGGCKDKVVSLMLNDFFVAGPTGVVNVNVPYTSIIDITRQPLRQDVTKETVVIRYRAGEGKPPKAVALRFDGTSFDDLLGVLCYLGPGAVKISTRSQVEKPIEATIAGVAESSIARVARSASSSRENAQLLSEAKALLAERPKTRVAFDAGDSVVTEVYRSRITRLYRKYCPEKAARTNAIEEALVTFRGDEETLMRALVKKYGPEPPISDDDDDVAAIVAADAARDGGEAPANHPSTRPPTSNAAAANDLTAVAVAPEASARGAGATSPVDHRDIQPRAVTSSTAAAVTPALKRAPLTLANLESHTAAVGTVPALEGGVALPSAAAKGGRPAGNRGSAEGSMTISDLNNNGGSANGGDADVTSEGGGAAAAAAAVAASPSPNPATNASPTQGVDIALAPPAQQASDTQRQQRNSPVAVPPVPPVATASAGIDAAQKVSVPPSPQQQSQPQQPPPPRLTRLNSLASLTPAERIAAMGDEQSLSPIIDKSPHYSSPSNANKPGTPKSGMAKDKKKSKAAVDTDDDESTLNEESKANLRATEAFERGVGRGGRRSKDTTRHGRSEGNATASSPPAMLDSMNSAAIAMLLGDIASLRHEMHEMKRSGGDGQQPLPPRAEAPTASPSPSSQARAKRKPRTVKAPISVDSEYDTDKDEAQAKPVHRPPRLASSAAVGAEAAGAREFSPGKGSSSARLGVTAALTAVKEAFSAAGRALDMTPCVDPSFVREFNRLDGPLHALHVALRPFMDERVVAAVSAPSLHDTGGYSGGGGATSGVGSRRREVQREVYLPPAWTSVDLGEVNRLTYPPSTKKYHRLIFEQRAGPGTRRVLDLDDADDVINVSSASQPPAQRVATRAAQVPDSEIVIATRAQHATRYGGWIIRAVDILSVCAGAVRRLPIFAGGAVEVALYDATNPLGDIPLLRGASLSEQGGYSAAKGALRDRPDDELCLTFATRRHVIVLEFDDPVTRDNWLRRLLVLLHRNRQSSWFAEAVAPPVNRLNASSAAHSRASPGQAHGNSSYGKAAAAAHSTNSTTQRNVPQFEEYPVQQDSHRRAALALDLDEDAFQRSSDEGGDARSRSPPDAVRGNSGSAAAGSYSDDDLSPRARPVHVLSFVAAAVRDLHHNAEAVGDSGISSPARPNSTKPDDVTPETHRGAPALQVAEPTRVATPSRSPLRGSPAGSAIGVAHHSSRSSLVSQREIKEL